MAILSKGISVKYQDAYQNSTTGVWGPTGTADPVEVKNLTSVPALGGTVEKVDVTTLKDGAYVYIQGLQTYEDLDFGLIYDKTEYKKVYDAVKEQQVPQGPTGAMAIPTKYWEVEFPDGVKFNFAGQANLRTEGAEVNGALTATLTVTPVSEITPTFPA